jgi:hypothetical protein
VLIGEFGLAVVEGKDFWFLQIMNTYLMSCACNIILCATGH